VRLVKQIVDIAFSIPPWWPRG